MDGNRRRKTMFAGILACLGLLVILSACQRTQRTAIIGVAMPSYGLATVRAASDEIASWNDAGGTVVTVVGDDAATDTNAEADVRRALRMLNQPQMVGVVGHGGSRGSLVAAPLYNEAGVVQIVPTGTAEALAKAGPWTLTLAADDRHIARTMVDFAVDRLGAATATVVYISEEYGYGLADEIGGAALVRGLAVLDAFPLSDGADVPALAELSLHAGRPDVVLIAGRDEEAGPLVKAFSALAPGLRFVGSDGVELNEAYRRMAGACADSLYAVTFWHADRPDSTSRAFVERFRRVNNSEPYASYAMRHDAVMVLAEAARATGGNRRAMLEWLRSLGEERPPYPGVTGPISFLPGSPQALVLVQRRGDRIVAHSWLECTR
jgi:branched-chain amino acid transport system substrate-binding protein